jgi:hypothetical protein
MKAITVRPAWAWAIVHGRPVEIRSWRTLHRGPLAIHASASISSADDDARVIERQSGDLVSARLRSAALVVPQDLECGAIVGRVLLHDCQWIPFLLEALGDMAVRGDVEAKHKLRCLRPWLGDPFSGKPFNAFAWFLSDPHACKPFDCKGKLGFWNVPDERVEVLP